MAHIIMRFPEGRAKALTLSYDDGVEQDIRLIDIMKNHGLKGTFNLNSGLYAPAGTVYPAGQIHRRMTEERVTALFADAGMEVAVHGLTHPFLEQLSPVNCTKEVLADRENLERQFHTIVRGMAYPYGSTSDSVVDTLKACGIVYARTTVSTGSFAIPTDWLRLPATCHHRDERLPQLTKRFIEDDVGNHAPWLFYLWGHSYEFEMNDNWEIIETFAEKTGGHTDIWYATNIAIYEYVQAYNRLVFSVDETRCTNPTDRTLWLLKDGVSVVIPAGKSVSM